MTRSIQKGPFADLFLWKLRNNKKLEEQIAGASGESQLVLPKIWSRRSCILPEFVGCKVEIYTGKTFINLLITEEMIGHKFGEFAKTRKKGAHKKKGKKK